MKEFLGPLIAGLFALATGALTFRQATSASRDASRVESQRIDAAAYDRAKAMYEDAIRDQERRLTRQDQRIADLERRDLAHEWRERSHLELLTRHATWDRAAARALAEAGSPVDPPPPLYPSSSPGGIA